jgi:hypothetical protein
MTMRALFPAVAAVAISVAGLAAAESLGDPAADLLVAKLQERAGAAVLACRISGAFVVCSGSKVGDCLADGWLVNHDGSECRKKLGE